MRASVMLTTAALAALTLGACGKSKAPADGSAPAQTAAAAAPGAAPAPDFPASTPLSAAALARCATATPAGLKGGPLPSSLTFLPCVIDLRTPDREDWSTRQFPPEPWGAEGPDTLKAGRLWHAIGDVHGAPADNKATWAALRAGFIGAGWQEVKAWPTQPVLAVMHYARAGVEAWADVEIGQAPGAEIDVIEVAPMPLTFALPAPAAVPEKVAAEKGDFPFLPPIPGSTSHGGHHDPSPMTVMLPQAATPEIVAPGAMVKSYKPADGVSETEWFTFYVEALKKAGWTIVNTFHSSDAAITAHYGLNGRNIWAYLHMNGDGYDFSVGDEATAPLAAGLAKDCHVALTGVLFDFNKSTLKPESDPVLDRVRELLVKDPALKLEVQGHTDNVGSDSYNQTLSESRAAAVLAWLTQHGVAAGRLTSKGYGKTLPVADNATDEGRAKNRRVEIANPACSLKRR